ncbi:hypothetical protein [Methylobacterium haplocladii]|uniref:Flagellar biosynthesis protein FliO n=1 Tax=Methylobacterium haplocladii TaxID=1176176 RepID=A0A512IT53_9HYPH|nr:hypothetical protein [Methylobacterium haplocladii]GEP00895.1 hypothetical protein MHA02_32820 [Methylobacterium haplocladii]GJD82221.1 hypothetical protein HPGCJGGD_0073 [Methylobacterium haplocladii]
MPEFFSSDGPYYLQFLVIFLVILVLLMGIVLLFRRIAGRGLSMSARATNRSRQPRLGIVDIYELDRHRQLILLRRDNVEHLLLVGGPNDVVVERNVIRGAGSQLPGETSMRQEPAADMLPDPGIQANPAALGTGSFEMPLVVPQPTPGTNGHVSATTGRPPPLDPALFEPEAPPAERSAAEPARSRIGISQIGSILRRMPPPLVDPRPEPASERVRPEPAAPTGSAESQPIVPPAPTSAGAPRPVDPAALSDMARQLETALRRQSSAVTPPPGQGVPAPASTEPMPPPPPAAAPPVAVEPVIAVATARPNPTFLIGRANPVPQPTASEPKPDPDPIAAAMAAAPPPPTASEPPPPASETKPAPQGGGTPFTVEEIETEFARLLGRPLDRKT